MMETNQIKRSLFHVFTKEATHRERLEVFKAWSTKIAFISVYFDALLSILTLFLIKQTSIYYAINLGFLDLTFTLDLNAIRVLTTDGLTVIMVLFFLVIIAQRIAGYLDKKLEKEAAQALQTATNQRKEEGI
jgi:hypothetical protein